MGDIFSTRILAHLGARGATNYYRPISIFGFLICYKLFGLLPYGFHLANLLLHALIVCLLFGLSKRLFQDQWLAFAAAAIFALHPDSHRIGGVGIGSDGPRPGGVLPGHILVFPRQRPAAGCALGVDAAGHGGELYSGAAFQRAGGDAAASRP